MPVTFESIAQQSGLAFRWPKLPTPLTILDAFGCGCAFLDYDGDGWQDLLLVADPYPRLYRNWNGKQFEDVTSTTGLSRLRGAWKGCAVGDYDGDERPDLLLTGYHCLALMRNESDGTWSNRTREAGLFAGQRWASSAGFMDLNADGHLDLVILNYVRFGPGDRKYCEPKPQVKAGCPPRYYLPQTPEIWRNTGVGRFRDVSSAAGMEQATGTAQVLAFADVDDDADLDFYVGNDGVAADLMLNDGDFHFRNQGLESGVAYGADGSALAAMSADFADYDHDGHFDLFVTGFSGEADALLRGEGGGAFKHAGREAGLDELTVSPLGFGAAWIDLDNDGWEDLAVANGHVYERAAEIYPGSSFLQPLLLLRNETGERFNNLTPVLGREIGTPMLGRGLASGDFDNDGRVDLVVVDYSRGPVLLHNTSPPGNHWITLDLRDRRPGARNRFAYGARVEARGEGRTWIAQVSPASSYLSSRDPRVHLGLGNVSRLDAISIRWPGGQRQELRNVAVDRILRISRDQPPSSAASAPGGENRQ